MNKKASVFFLLVFIPSFIFCDSTAVQTYIENFSKGDITAKVNVLKTAAADRNARDSVWNLYETALQYAWENYANLDSYYQMNEIISIAVRGLRNIDRNESLDTLWKLFLNYPDSETRAEILITIANLGKGNQSIIDIINNYLMEINFLFNSGESVDYFLVSACITAIMELGDSSSYSVLFSMLNSGYPEVITSEAYGALDVIPGELKQFLAGVIEKNPPEEKFIAFRTGINSQRLSVSERGQLAELALNTGLSYSEENVDITEMRYAAVLALTSLRWTRASAIAVRNYYRVREDYLKDTVPKNRLIEAIACLGAVGNSEAALILGLQLGLINATTESRGTFDAEITMAIVEALGSIGDNAAFDQLFFATTLSYGESINAAAREAINRLRW